ncbi:MAG: VacJ family lipoprotein, partial [Nitrospirae bacterium]
EKTINSTSLHLGDYEDLVEGALDPYVSLQDAYLQHRDKEVKR